MYLFLRDNKRFFFKKNPQIPLLDTGNEMRRGNKTGRGWALQFSLFLPPPPPPLPLISNMCLPLPSPPQLRRKRDSYPSLPPQQEEGIREEEPLFLVLMYVLAQGRWGEKIMVNLFFSREGCLIWGRRRYNKAPPNLRHIHALASTQTPFPGSPPPPPPLSTFSIGPLWQQQLWREKKYAGMRNQIKSYPSTREKETLQYFNHNQ